MSFLEGESRELLQAIYREIHKAARAAVAPFTRGGKLDLSSPNIVGHLPVSRGGTGGTTGGGGGGGVPPPPDTYAYLIDGDGNYLIDADGAYLFEYL